MARLAFAALALLALGLGAEGQRLRIKNGCWDEPLWVAHMAQAESGPDPQNLKLCPGETHIFNTPNGLAGTRYWAKMRCNSVGDKCEIGESGGPGETCDNQIGCAPPVDTKFEASFGANGVDWVDVSLVDGWTLPFKFTMSKQCSPGDGHRKPVQEIDCSELAFDGCPHAEDVGKASNSSVDLRVRHPDTGAVVGCYSPCSKLTFTNWGNKAAKFGPADNLAKEYCCPTPPESPAECRAGPVKDTKFVRAVHQNCPGVYGYSYDDGMGLLLCPQDTVYEMTFFCPAGTGQKPSSDDGCRSLPKPSTSTAMQARPAEADAKKDEEEAYDCALYGKGAPDMWPFKQAAWCCLHKKIGCPSGGQLTEHHHSTEAATTTPAASSRTSSSDVTTKAAATSTSEAPATTSRKPGLRHTSKIHAKEEEEFDCSTGFSWLWSPERADWCCLHKGRGCSAKALAHGDEQKDAAEASESSEHSSTEGRFDCEVGYPRWVSRWSDEKKAWCCKHASRSCPSTTVATTTSMEYSCTVWWPEDEEKWSPTKRDWCCKHKNRGCATTTTPQSLEEPITTYNCAEFPASLPLAAWGDLALEPVESWSADKKDWCCRHEHRGCGDSADKDAAKSSKAAEPRKHDCEADFWGWMVNWEEEKKEWCCKHEGRGCVEEHSWIGYAAKKFAQPPGPPHAASATAAAARGGRSGDQATGLLASLALLAVVSAALPSLVRATCAAARRGPRPPEGAVPLVEVDVEEDSCME